MQSNSLKVALIEGLHEEPLPNYPVRIDYYINCFDRYLSIKVNGKDEIVARDILERAYCEWCEDDNGWCCEEFILLSLKEHNIEYAELEPLETEE